MSAGSTLSAAQLGRHSAAKAAERTITRIFPPSRETDSLAQQFLRDGQELDITGSFVNAPDFGIAIELFDGVIPGDTDPAVDLDGFRRHLFRDLRTIILRHGRLRQEGESGG